MRELTLDETGMVHPHPGGQQGFCEDWTSEYIALEGGMFGGKTWAGARKLVTLHIHNAFDDLGRATYVGSAAIAPTYKNAREYVVPALREALTEVGEPYKWHSQDQALELPRLGTVENPSLIYIRTAERPDRISGWTVGAGWGDEPTRWPEDYTDPLGDAYVQFQLRIRHPLARIRQRIFTYTNEGDGTRMYQEFHPLRPGYAIYTLPTHENPVAVAAGFVETMTNALPVELQEQYLMGKAVNLRGALAYSAFTDANLDGRVELIPNIPLCLTLDFNIAPGMHGLLGHYVGEDFLIAHELFAPRLDVAGLVSMLRTLIGTTGGWRWPELQVFGDATGKSEWAGTGESCYSVLFEALEQSGIPKGLTRRRTPESNPFVSDRINAVNAALCDVRGRRRVKINPRCAGLARDFQRVKRDEKGKGIDKSQPDLTHFSDCLGYEVAYLRPLRRDLHLNTTGGRFGV